MFKQLSFVAASIAGYVTALDPAQLLIQSEAAVSQAKSFYELF